MPPTQFICLRCGIDSGEFYLMHFYLSSVHFNQLTVPQGKHFCDSFMRAWTCFVFMKRLTHSLLFIYLCKCVACNYNKMVQTYNVWSCGFSLSLVHSCFPSFCLETHSLVLSLISAALLNNREEEAEGNFVFFFRLKWH